MYPGKLLNYIRKGALSNDEGGFTLFHNASYPSLKGISRDFDQVQARINESNRIKVSFHHVMLNFSPKDNDNLNSEILEALARKYIEERGFDKTVCFAQAHRGRNGGYHVHLMAGNLPVGPINRSLRISQKEYKRIQLAIEEFQVQNFELKHSIVYMGQRLTMPRDIAQEDRNRRKENEFQAKRKNTRSLIKDEIKRTLINILNKSTSYDDFIDNVLQTEGIEIYQRSGNTQGVIYKNKRFRFKTLGLIDMIETLDLNEILQIEQQRMKRLEELKRQKTKKQIGKNRKI